MWGDERREGTDADEAQLIQVTGHQLNIFHELNIFNIRPTLANLQHMVYISCYYKPSVTYLNISSPFPRISIKSYFTSFILLALQLSG